MYLFSAVCTRLAVYIATTTAINNDKLYRRWVARPHTRKYAPPNSPLANDHAVVLRHGGVVDDTNSHALYGRDREERTRFFFPNISASSEKINGYKDNNRSNANSNFPSE